MRQRLRAATSDDSPKRARLEHVTKIGALVALPCRHGSGTLAMPMLTRCLAGLLAIASAAGASAGGSDLDAKPRLSLSIDDEDGLIEEGQLVTVTATLLNRSRATLEGRLAWLVHTVAFEPETRDPVDVSVEPRQSQDFTFQIALPSPGFADIECRLIGSGQEVLASKRTRLVHRPEEVRFPTTREPDFEAFWEGALEELRAIPLDARERPESRSETAEVLEVTLRSVGGVHVRGWLEVPVGDGPFPVLIRVPGYGQNMQPTGTRDMIVFSFNPRAHGNSQDEVPGRPVDYWIRGLDEKETYFYRGAYLDCLRAVDYIASREDVDPERIAVWGGSQGGGFAFAMAALDRRIDLCIADIPFLCDWVNYFKLSHWPEMTTWIEESEERSWPTTLRTLSYFDTMNLTERIRCPTFMGVGLQDRVCPPTTSFAAFNRIPGEKIFRIYPESSHGLPGKHYAEARAWMRSVFELDQAVTPAGLGDAHR